MVHDTERDYFMSPDEAKDYGIIDAVYSVSGDSLIAQAHDAGRAGGEGSTETALEAAERNGAEAPAEAPAKAER